MRAANVLRAVSGLLLLLLAVALAVGPATAEEPKVTGQAASAASAPSKGNSSWVVLPCRYPGNASETLSTDYIRDMFSHEKGLTNYFKEQSYNNLNISAQVQNPRTMSSSPAQHDTDAIFQACTAAHDTTVNFSNFDAVAMVFNQSIGSHYGGTTSQPIERDGTTRYWPFAMISNNGKNEALWAHEMSHAYGLPDGLGGGPDGADEAPTWWDPMSFPCGIYFHDNGPSIDPTYTCIPGHTRAFYKDNILGWIPDSRRYTAKVGRQTIDIERLAKPAANGNYLIARIPIKGTQQFFTLEARMKAGFDDTQLRDGIIINRTYGTFFNPKPFFAATVGKTTTDSLGQLWLDYDDALREVGEVYTNDQFGYSVEVNSKTATYFNVTIKVQAKCGGSQTTDVGTSRRDTIGGTGAADITAGLGGDDSVRGRGGDDTLCGNGGKDTLKGDGGADNIYGSTGDDYVVVRETNAVRDSVDCGSGVDTVIADRLDKAAANCEKVKRNK